MYYISKNVDLFQTIKDAIERYVIRHRQRHRAVKCGSIASIKSEQNSKNTFYSKQLVTRDTYSRLVYL